MNTWAHTLRRPWFSLLCVCFARLLWSFAVCICVCKCDCAAAAACICDSVGCDASCGPALTSWYQRSPSTEGSPPWDTVFVCLQSLAVSCLPCRPACVCVCVMCWLVLPSVLLLYVVYLHQYELQIASSLSPALISLGCCQACALGCLYAVKHCECYGLNWFCANFLRQQLVAIV